MMPKPLFSHVLNLRNPVTSTTVSPPSGPAGGDLQGTYPNPTINPASLPWTPSGTTLTPTDVTKSVTIPVAATEPLTVGSRTIKGRLCAGTGQDAVQLAINRTYGGVQDDATKPSWIVNLRSDSDFCQISRFAPGGAGANVFTMDNLGNLTITGNTATKAAPGTAWVNPSDPRLKRDVGPYTVGLAALLQLQPITYKYNGLGETVDDGTVCHGFDTAAVAPVMPECIRTLRRKLHPNDEDKADIAAMDVSDILLALVNAVKELATRVAALEGKP